MPGWLRQLLNPARRWFLSTTRESDVTADPDGISHSRPTGGVGHVTGEDAGYDEQTGAEARQQDERDGKEP